MSIRQGRTPKHWNYFLSVEEDLSALSRWIEFHPENYGCYSIQLARLLMVASAEVDVIAKRLSASIDARAKAQSINKYQSVIVAQYQQLPAAVVTIPRFDLTLTPWKNWSTPNNPPLWWSANNKVKHHRNDNFSDANLKNALNSVAGLFILLAIYYGRDERSVTPAPALFDTQDFAYVDGNWLCFRNNPE